MNDATSGECVCPNDDSQCGMGMVDAYKAVLAAQKPIGVIVIPTNVAAGSVFDASGSVAACNTSVAPPVPLSVASYKWTASPMSIIVSGASTPQVTVNPAAGTLTLTVTDNCWKCGCRNRHAYCECGNQQCSHIGWNQRHRLPQGAHRDADPAHGRSSLFTGHRRAGHRLDAHVHVQQLAMALR